jgi:hypothetical protein
MARRHMKTANGQTTSRGDGGIDVNEPSHGWKGSATSWVNPRPPSVPATLALNLEEYFAAACLMGLLASQDDEPNHKWVRDWSFKMGAEMAREATRRRKRVKP